MSFRGVKRLGGPARAAPSHDSTKRREPDSGWFLCFADLDNDEVEGLIEPVPNHEGAPARLFYVPPETPPVESDPPESLRGVLIERRVVGVPQLTLPDDYEVGDRLELDPG